MVVNHVPMICTRMRRVRWDVRIAPKTSSVTRLAQRLTLLVNVSTHTDFVDLIDDSLKSILYGS